MEEVSAHRDRHPPVVGPPAVPADLGRTAENKRLVERLASAGLIGGDLALLRAAAAPDLVEHGPAAPSGVEALAAPASDGRRRHTRVHRLVGEGDLVLLQAEGVAGGVPAALYDLFRVGAGRIREHWSVTQAIPAAMAHSNGMF
jgi:predicted SnoaL-like aldol condensation-catalyzing enzyme